MTGVRQWAAPSLEQALELASGRLPHELRSWDEVPGWSQTMRPDSDATGEPPPLLPTPTASLVNDGEDPVSWLARQRRLLEHGYNGNGMGLPLTVAVKMLPTPKASLGPNGKTMDAARRVAEDRGDRGNLDEAVALMPTPATTDARGARNRTSGRQQESTHHDEVTLSDMTRLLPTPRASDGDRGPDYAIADREGSGGPSLVTEAARLLPTPTQADAQRAGTHAKGGNPTLPHAAEHLLPTPTARHHKDSPGQTVPTNALLGRVAPTIPSGDRTEPPSTGGPPSSDGDPQPPLWTGD